LEETYVLEFEGYELKGLEHRRRGCFVLHIKDPTPIRGENLQLNHLNLDAKVFN
jgi:hypothetical protein